MNKLLGKSKFIAVSVILLFLSCVNASATTTLYDDTIQNVTNKTIDCNENTLLNCASGDMTKAVYDTNDDGTVDSADAATALSANGSNCDAGEIPLGTDASGNAEGCYEPTEADITDLSHTPEGTAIKSTGEAGGTKFLREDGDNTSSWQSVTESDISDLAHTATAITDGLIVEADLNASTPTDEYCLTYESGGGPDLVWQTCGAGYTNLTQFIDQTAWRLFYSNADGDVIELALGSSGTYLKSNGASSAPSWGSSSGGGPNTYTTTFTSADLKDSVRLTFTHSLGIQYFSGVKLFDDDDIPVTGFTVIPLDSDNAHLFVLGMVIDNTWRLVISE